MAPPRKVCEISSAMVHADAQKRAQKNTQGRRFLTTNVKFIKTAHTPTKNVQRFLTNAKSHNAQGVLIVQDFTSPSKPLNKPLKAP
jgi:hypothetical protein